MASSQRIISLAVKVTGDTAGLNLNKAERALQSLQAETAKVGEVFKKFEGSSAAAANAAQQFGLQSTLLNKALEDGRISAPEYAKEFAELAKSAEAEAAALERAAQITARFTPEIDKYRAAQARLSEDLRLGRIEQEIYNAALEDAARRLTDADRAALGLAARVQETAAASADTALRFNELSGIFAVLPGPLGAIAGRISGIASASEGLTRVFAGGLRQGLTAVADSFRTLVGTINPATAAIAGFAVAGTGIGRALDRLEGRVENLGNLATRLGVSFEFIQVLEDAAKRSGTSVDSVAFAFTRLQRTLAGTDEESKKVVRALGSVGLAVDDIAGKSPEEQYKVIGQALLQIEDPAKRSAAAIELFGRSGATLLPFFNNLPKAARDFRRFGDGINELDKARIDDFGEAIDGLNRATTRLGEVALTPFAGLAEGITKAAAQFVNAITAIAEVVGKLLTPAFDQIGVVVGIASSAIEGLAVLFRTLAGVVEPFGKFILPVVVAQLALWNQQVFINAAGSLTRGFTAAARAASSLGTATGRAAVGNAALAVSVRALLSSTGIGVLAVAVGFLVEKLLSWGEAASAVGDASEEAGNKAKTAAEKAREAYKQQEEAAKEAAERRKQQIKEESANVQKLVEQYTAFKRAEREFGGDRQRLEASDRVAQIEREITRVRQQQSQALRDGALAEAEQAKRRLQTLEEVRKQEQDIASGRAKQLEEARQKTEELAKAEEKRAQAERDNIQKVIEKFQEQQQIERRFAGDNKRFEAAQRVAEIEKEIARVQKERDIAAQNFDDKGAAAAKERLDLLFEIKKQEEDIASGRAKAVEDAKKLAEEDRKRIEKLLDGADKSRELTRNLDAVQNEINRVQRENAGLFGQLDAASKTRIRELKVIQGELSEKLRATAQGFEDGFARAFASTQSKFTELRRKAEDFGDSGKEAAAKLQKGIEEAQALAKKGILNKEAYEEEVALRTKLFQQELEGIKKAADERRKINEFVDKQLAAQRFGGDQQRAEAAQRAIDIEKEIIRVQKDIQAARAAGRKDEVDAGITRIGQLDQVLAKERDIATGRKKLEEDLAKQREEAIKAVAQQQQQIQQQQQKARDEQAKAAEAEFNRQRSRIRDLNTLGAGVISGTDLRSSEGANLFQQLTANAQDPALIEARLQTRRLGELVNLVQSLTNLPIRTIGALGVG